LGELVELHGVVKKFGRVAALRGVSLCLRRGEVVGLLGPNASGKTTLLKIIMGFIRPDRGEVRVLGRDPYLDPSIRARVGYVPEDVLLYDSLTVREFLYFMGRMRKMDPSTYIDRARLLATLFEIEDKMDCLVGSLSKGDRQKLALISALLHEPDVLILDEPLASLDLVAARVLKEVLREIRSRGGGVIISTHILSLAEAICDRIYLMNEGLIVAEGDLRSIKEVVGADEDLEEVLLKLTKKDEVLEALIRILKEEF